MNVNRPVMRAMEWVSATSHRAVVLVFASLFLVVYVPATISLAVFGYYPHVIDTVAVLLATLIATLVPLGMTFVRLPSYHLPDRSRRRENLGWLSIAAFSAVGMTARAIYAVSEFSAGPTGDSIPIADGLFGASFVFLVAGLILIPWSDKRGATTSLLFDAGLVVVAIGTLFWPLLIGPALQGELSGVIPTNNLIFFLVGITILSATVLWIMVRDVRTELRLVAATFVLSVIAMVIIQLSYLSFMVATQSADSDPAGLLTTNAATSLSFLLITLAALFRLMSVVRPASGSEQVSVVQQSPVRIWQMILPFPIVGFLLIMRLGMEVFEWRLDYRTGMVAGIGAIAAFMLVRQVQMLRHNQYLHRRVANTAIRDGLTGLFNHRAMHDVLRTEVARAERRDEPLAVLFLDLDHFKSLNDSYGHKQGDRVLVSIADLLEESGRGRSVAGRYGGEEFMVILPGMGRSEAVEFAEELRERIARQQFIFGGERTGLTVSIGAAVYPLDASDPETLISVADEAMYRAKKAGRNRTMSSESLTELPA